KGRGGNDCEQRRGKKQEKRYITQAAVSFCHSQSNSWNTRLARCVDIARAGFQCQRRKNSLHTCRALTLYCAPRFRMSMSDEREQKTGPCEPGVPVPYFYSTGSTGFHARQNRPVNIPEPRRFSSAAYRCF